MASRDLEPSHLLTLIPNTPQPTVWADASALQAHLSYMVSTGLYPRRLPGLGPLSWSPSSHAYPSGLCLVGAMSRAARNMPRRWSSAEADV